MHKIVRARERAVHILFAFKSITSEIHSIGIGIEYECVSVSERYNVYLMGGMMIPISFVFFTLNPYLFIYLSKLFNEM